MMQTLERTVVPFGISYADLDRVRLKEFANATPRSRIGVTIQGRTFSLWRIEGGDQSHAFTLRDIERTKLKHFKKANNRRVVLTLNMDDEPVLRPETGDDALVVKR